MKAFRKLAGFVAQTAGAITLFVAALGSVAALWIFMIIPFVLYNASGMLLDRPDRVVWNFGKWAQFEWRKQN